MKKNNIFLLIFFVIIISCKQKIKIYPIKKIPISNSFVILSADTIIPNYYISYGNKSYRLDNYLFSLSKLSFDYDIFTNINKNNSFVLSFSNDKHSGQYSYTIFNIENKKIVPRKTFFFQCTDYKSNQIIDSNQDLILLQKKDNDTIAKYWTVTLSLDAASFFDRNTNFYDLIEKVEYKYILRNETLLTSTKPHDEIFITNKFLEKLKKTELMKN